VIEKFLQQERELERARIVSETARIPWLELQRFFAAGKVMLVAIAGGNYGSKRIL
jgi:hypothetical protein